MREQFLPFSPPSIGDEEIAEVVDTLRSDWITTGPKTARFEEEFANYVGSTEAVAVSSCTAALHLSLLSLGIGPGDVVITTPMTFCSAVHVIEHVGARPVFSDVERETLNIDPWQLSEVVRREVDRNGGRVKAIMPCHLYGHPCDIAQILDIANKYDLAVTDDAAHALPASYRDQRIGSAQLGSAGRVLTSFSFYATKNLTTAEGGMLVGPQHLLEQARLWSLHGMNRDAWKRYGARGSWFYEVVRPGFKYNMTDIQAALGLHQLRKLPAFHARRQEITRRYSEAFAEVEEVETPAEHEDVEHAWHLYVLRLNLDRMRITRDGFITEMKSRNIGCSVHFIPMHLHEYYRNRYSYQPEDFPVAHSEYQRIVSLPLSPRMTDRDVDDVIEAVCDIACKHSKTRLFQ